MKPITWIQLFILCAGIGQARAVEAQDVRFPFTRENRLADKSAVNETGGTDTAFR